MALKKYIGARYAPKFMGAWDKESQYAALSVVYYNDQSFVSRKTVPANTEILNTEFWIKSADWNAQVTQYNQHVEEYNQNVEKYNQNVEAYQQAVSTFYADTLHSYDTKADMVADQDLQLGDTLLTCGDKAIGDTGGSFYQVVAETSAKAVALANGLYALPFEFQPYDYAEFAEKTDQYKQETDEQIAQMKEVSLHTYNTQSQMKADRSLTANTVVMTAGEATIGDNKGSFYEVQQTSDKSDAVPLDNGMKAVPFAMNVGTVAGTELSFQGRSDAVGVWNVKAPNTITIPVTVPDGGTVTAFLGVLYGSSQQTVNVNLDINSGNVKKLAFTDGGDSTHDKIVVYTITAKNDGGSFSWGQSTTASWTISYQTDHTTVVQTYPESGLLPLSTQLASSSASLWSGTMTKTITISSVTADFGDHRPRFQIQEVSSGGESTDIFNYTSASTTTNLTIAVNKQLVAGKRYNIICYSVGGSLPSRAYGSATQTLSSSILTGYATAITPTSSISTSFSLTFTI